MDKIQHCMRLKDHNFAAAPVGASNRKPEGGNRVPRTSPTHGTPVPAPPDRAALIGRLAGGPHRSRLENGLCRLGRGIAQGVYPLYLLSDGTI